LYAKAGIQELKKTRFTKFKINRQDEQDLQEIAVGAASAANIALVRHSGKREALIRNPDVFVWIPASTGMTMFGYFTAQAAFVTISC